MLAAQTGPAGAGAARSRLRAPSGGRAARRRVLVEDGRCRTWTRGAGPSPPPHQSLGIGHLHIERGEVGHESEATGAVEDPAGGRPRPSPSAAPATTSLSDGCARRHGSAPRRRPNRTRARPCAGHSTREQGCGRTRTRRDHGERCSSEVCARTYRSSPRSVGRTRPNRRLIPGSPRGSRRRARWTARSPGRGDAGETAREPDDVPDQAEVADVAARAETARRPLDGSQLLELGSAQSSNWLKKWPMDRDVIPRQRARRCAALRPRPVRDLLRTMGTTAGTHRYRTTSWDVA